MVVQVDGGLPRVQSRTPLQTPKSGREREVTHFTNREPSKILVTRSDLEVLWGIGLNIEGVVTSVAPGCPASSAGLKLGDRIVSVNNVPTLDGTAVKNECRKAQYEMLIVQAPVPDTLSVTLHRDSPVQKWGLSFDGCGRIVDFASESPASQQLERSYIGKLIWKVDDVYVASDSQSMLAMLQRPGLSVSLTLRNSDCIIHTPLQKKDAARPASVEIPKQSCSPSRQRPSKSGQKNLVGICQPTPPGSSPSPQAPVRPACCPMINDFQNVLFFISLLAIIFSCGFWFFSGHCNLLWGQKSVIDSISSDADTTKLLNDVKMLRDAHENAQSTLATLQKQLGTLESKLSAYSKNEHNTKKDKKVHKKQKKDHDHGDDEDSKYQKYRKSDRKKLKSWTESYKKSWETSKKKHEGKSRFDDDEL